jgi:transcriptional regulator with XRE-family HTH domain
MQAALKQGVRSLATQLSSPLAECRLAAGYTQESFAEKIGADRSTIGRWERGTQSPQPWQRPDLAHVLNVSLAQLDDILRRTKRSTSPDPVVAPVAPRSTSSLDTALIKFEATHENDTSQQSRLLGARSLLESDLGRSITTADDGITLTATHGRFFSGTVIPAGLYPASDDGRIVANLSADLERAPFLQRPGRSLVIGVVENDDQPARLFGLDGRQARTRLARAPRVGRMLVPRAYELDDLTVGLLWAVSNLDEALLDDDAALSASRNHLAGYNQQPRSAVGHDVAVDLSPVSAMWLGSDFCARHILRHADTLTDVPAFWTREQRGEEASTWLLFAHKYAYLRQSAATLVGTGMTPTRAFCIPPASIGTSSRSERILLLLAVALMESFGIRVHVCVEPEYTSMQGFVFDQRQHAIVANWVGTDGIWQVDLTASGPLLREFADATGYTQAHSVIAGQTPAARLAALTAYLDLNWEWLTRRCGDLAAYGSAGILQPRSRLLSVDGIDQACRFLASIAQQTGH